MTNCKNCGHSPCCCSGKTIINGLSKPGKRGVAGQRGPAGPSGTSNLTVKNTVFVMKNGNDSTGMVERFDKPFLTIAAARTAINTAFTSRTDSARVLVDVKTGTYAENIILDKYVDYNLNDCTILGGITDDNVDFGSSEDNVWTNVISGQAKIYNPGGSAVTVAMILFKPNSKVLFHGSRLISVTDDSVAIVNSRKTRIYCDEIASFATDQNYKYALEMGQGFNSSDYTQSLVEVIGADIYNASGSIASTVSFNSGGASKNQTLSLINCRVKNTNSGDGILAKHKSAITVGPVQPSNGKLNLYNTVLYSQSGNSIYVDTGNTLNVKYIHSNMANVATAGGGTLTNVLGTVLTINSSLTPEF